MSRAVFDALVAEFEVRPIPEPTPRRIALPGLPGKADVVIGMRRVGKTWRLYQHMHDLLRAGVPRERLLYVNLEDERLPIDAGELSHLLDAWYVRYPAVAASEHWLFLDEVQNVPGWERFVRRMLDAGNVRVLLTGSSSKLLSAEIATSLRGRALATEVLPFSFHEAVLHAGLGVPERWPAAPQVRATLGAAFETYFESGGFPEVQGVDAFLRRRVLQDYVDVAMLRDVVERHQVGNVVALRWIVRRLLAHPSGRFTANKLYRDLKAQGLAIGKDTVHEYLNHLQDAHLVYTVPIWAASQARQHSNPRKAYLVDPALSRTAAFAKPQDVGHRLENLVYLELRRRGFDEIGYLQTPAGYEVDLCARSPAGDLHLVQVSADLDDPETREREIRALADGMDALGLDRGLVVTRHHDEEVRVGPGTVTIVPAWRWLLT